MVHTVEGTFGGKSLRLETGRVAKQAGGSCWLQMGDTIVLGTATMAATAREGLDFFPRGRLRSRHGRRAGRRHGLRAA